VKFSIGLDGAACYLLDMCAALIVLLPAVVLSSLSNRTYDKGTAFFLPKFNPSVSSDLSFFSTRFSFRGKLGGGEDSGTMASKAGQGRAMRKEQKQKQKGSWECGLPAAWDFCVVHSRPQALADPEAAPRTSQTARR
jgi:hypothetical protein